MVTRSLVSVVDDDESVRESLPDMLRQFGESLDLDLVSGVLANGKNARLYKRLVFDMQLAQDVSAGQYSSRYGSMYIITVTARPSNDPPPTVLARLTAIVDEELETLRQAPPDAREVARVKNQYEASFLTEMETVEGKADRLNGYYVNTGNPDYFAQDLGRYTALTPADVVSMLLMLVPLYLLFEISVILAGVIERRREQSAAIEPGALGERADA